MPLANSLEGTAKDAYKSAKLLFHNSDFAGAAAKFQQAYDLSHDARLLFNVAICEKNLRQYGAMEGLLERYARESGGLSGEQKTAVDDALAAVKDLVGSIALTVDVEGATVTVDSQSAGTTPLGAPLILDLGKHHIEVSKSGFETTKKDIQVTGGASESISLPLLREVHDGRLLITAEPNTTISVDGKVVGADRFDGRFPSGSHEVAVTETGKVPYRADVEIHDRETRTLDVTLLREAHAGAPVWPWIVGGAVVAAGAVVGGYLLFKPQDSTKPVPTGSLDGTTF